jgi:hypothetical protein
MSEEAKRYSCGNGDGMFEDKNGFYVKYSQPTLFKVATEDSCVVLEKPSTPEEPYLSDTDCDVHTQWKIYLGRYNKAPSISQDRLELNRSRKMSNDYKKLTENTIKGWKLTENKLTESNKQLKEYKEVVDEIKKIDRFEMEAGLGYNEGLVYKEKESEGTWIKFETVDELLSKLNKD